MKHRYQELSLKYLLILLTSEERYRADETRIWAKQMRDCGMMCILQYVKLSSVQIDEPGNTLMDSGMQELANCHLDNTLVLTDDRKISSVCAKKGYICIGLDPDLETFFDGAEAVVSSVEDLDNIYIEETFQRAKGIPVLIAETERIRIREIVKEDIPALYEISRQEGMEYAFADPKQAECFEYARMEAYIANVYRFYGYGLWTVETLDGEIIGCCGVSDFRVPEHAVCGLENIETLFLYKNKAADKNAYFNKRYFQENTAEMMDSGLLLEMQYFVARRFQNQGYGTEMCRAVIKYVQERLPEYEICVRVHPENRLSVKLAQNLGFQYCR